MYTTNVTQMKDGQLHPTEESVLEYQIRASILRYAQLQGIKVAVKMVGEVVSEILDEQK